MPPRLFLSAYPLPVGSIQLGALVSNIRSPHQDAFTGGSEPIDIHDNSCVIQTSCQEPCQELERTKKTTVAAYLFKLLTLRWTSSGNTSSKLVADTSTLYELRNPQARFSDLVQQESVKKWLQEQDEDDTTVYMITAFQTASNQRVVRQDKNQLQGTAAVRDSGSPIAGSEVSVRGEHTDTESRGDTFSTPGERVFAFGYRRVTIRSVEEQTSRLDKNNRWAAIGDNRGETDQTDVDILEAVLEESDAEASGESEVIELGVEIEYRLLQNK